MPEIASSEVVVPGRLSATQHEALVSGLYEVQREVFAGVDRETFASYVIDSLAAETRILVHRDRVGQIVGYFALHVFEKQWRGRPVAILRAEAGMRRAFRGRRANASFGMRDLLRYLLAHPHRPIYWFSSLVHPSSYLLLTRYGRTVWPSAEAPVPPAPELALMLHLAEEFHLEVVDPARPLVRKVGWTTRDTDVERHYWETCGRPRARFFLAQNPGYSEGHGLLTLIPVNLGVLATAVLRHLRTETLRLSATHLGVSL